MYERYLYRGGLSGGTKDAAMIDTSKIGKILIVRTDRIGDVLLSTPIIKATRHTFPKAHIVFMARPYTSCIVNGNPYLDEVIVYDKYGAHRSWWGSLRFAFTLRKKRFDLALILHPTNRAHIVTFLAGIPVRIGYRKKFGFLLTEAIEDKKRFGQKHELEYNFDLAKLAGIEPIDKSLFMSIDKEDERFIDEVLEENGITSSDNLVAFHPGASCPSKRWPPKNFSVVGDRLGGTYNLKLVIVGGEDDRRYAKEMECQMKLKPLNLCGKLDLSQLAALIGRCKLFITNDNGPMHIASAVGTPVVAIFGRRQPGLSPTRWGPTGAKDVVLYKDVGCRECLAHNCRKGFLCLEAITVEDVLEKAKALYLR